MLIAVLFLVAGCSTKMSYYFLDWAIEWEVEEYIDLDTTQKAKFDEALAKFLLWHREEELPKYANQIEALSSYLNKHTLTPETWVQNLDLMKGHWARVYNFIKPDIVPLIGSLSDKQVKKLMEQLREEHKELVEEYSDKDQAELVTESNEKIAKQVKKWTGSVSDKQKTIINQANGRRFATVDMWIEYRHEWLRQFENALSQRHDIVLLDQRLTLLMTEADSLKSDTFKQKAAENNKNFGQMLVDLNETFTEKQRKKFNKTLDELVTDLTDLYLEKE